MTVTNVPNSGMIDPEMGSSALENKPLFTTECLTVDATKFKDVWLPMDQDTWRSIDLLEAYMRHVAPQNGLPLTEVYADGVYTREVFIEAGTLLTGKAYNEQHICIMLSGKIIVWTEGDGTKVHDAPCTIVSQPGTRRIGYAVEDTRWMTIHKNPGDVTSRGDVEKRLYMDRDDIYFSPSDIQEVENFLYRNMGLRIEAISSTLEVA